MFTSNATTEFVSLSCSIYIFTAQFYVQAFIDRPQYDFNMLIPDSTSPNPDCIVKTMKALVKIQVASSELS